MDKTALRRIFNRIIRDIVYRLIHFVIVKQNRAKFCLMIVNIYNNILCIRNRCKFFYNLTYKHLNIDFFKFQRITACVKFCKHKQSFDNSCKSVNLVRHIAEEFLYHSRIGIFCRNKTVAYKFYTSHRGFKFV